MSKDSGAESQDAAKEDREIRLWTAGCCVFLGALLAFGGVTQIRPAIEQSRIASVLLWVMLSVAGCSVIVFGLVTFFAPKAVLQDRLLISVGIGVAVGGAIGLYIGLTTQPLSDYGDLFWERSRQVCNGTGIPEAHTYSPAPGLHKIVATSTKGDRSWTSDLPSDWRPTSLENLELVLCVGNDERTVVEVCRYFGGTTTTRYQLESRAVLRSAHSAAYIDGTVLLGSMPKDCPDQKLPGSLPEIDGGRPSLAGARKWLSRYVVTSADK